MSSLLLLDGYKSIASPDIHGFQSDRGLKIFGDSYLQDPTVFRSLSSLVSVFGVSIRWFFSESFEYENPDSVAQEYSTRLGLPLWSVHPHIDPDIMESILLQEWDKVAFVSFSKDVISVSPSFLFLSTRHSKRLTISQVHNLQQFFSR